MFRSGWLSVDFGAGDSDAFDDSIDVRDENIIYRYKDLESVYRKIHNLHTPHDKKKAYSTIQPRIIPIQLRARSSAETAPSLLSPYTYIFSRATVCAGLGLQSDAPLHGRLARAYNGIEIEVCTIIARSRVVT